MKNIAMLAQTIYGRDPRVQRAAEALMAAGYSVEVYALRGAGEAGLETIKGVIVHRLPLNRRRGTRLRYVFEYMTFFVLCSMLLTTASRRKRYALIYVHTLPDALVFAALLPKLLGSRVVLDMHDPMPETFVSKYGLGAGHWIVRLLSFLESAAIRFADAVITVHEPLRDIFIRRGCPPQKITVVLNLTDLTGAGWIQAADRREFSTRPPLEVIYAGTLAPAYGVDIAIRAVASVDSRAPATLRLRIFGEGPQLPELRELVDSLRVNHLVEFHQPVDHKDIPQYLARADIGVAPSRRDALFALSLSNKVYEYVATGLPAVVSRSDAIAMYYPPDTLIQVSPGDVAELSDALLSLATSVDERRQRSEQGKRLVQRWNWGTERERLITLIDKLISPRKASSASFVG